MRNTLKIALFAAATVLGTSSSRATPSSYAFTIISDPSSINVTYPVGINDLGQIVGQYVGQDSADHGFIYSGGVYTTIDVPGANGTYVRHNNDAGQIVGSYNISNDPILHGFLYSGGVYTTIDIPGARETGPAGINNAARKHGILTTPVRLLETSPPDTYMGSYKQTVSLRPSISQLGVRETLSS